MTYLWNTRNFYHKIEYDEANPTPLPQAIPNPAIV